MSSEISIRKVTNPQGETVQMWPCGMPMGFTGRVPFEESDTFHVECGNYVAFVEETGFCYQISKKHLGNYTPAEGVIAGEDGVYYQTK